MCVCMCLGGLDPQRSRMTHFKNVCCTYIVLNIKIKIYAQYVHGQYRVFLFQQNAKLKFAKNGSLPDVVSIKMLLLPVCKTFFFTIYFTIQR